MTRVVGGMEIEQNQISVSGTAEIDDDTAELINDKRSYTLTLKVHLKGKGQDVGGLNTSPRENFRFQIDSIESLEDAGEITGQLQIGDDPAEPSDDA